MAATDSTLGQVSVAYFHIVFLGILTLHAVHTFSSSTTHLLAVTCMYFSMHTPLHLACHAQPLNLSSCEGTLNLDGAGYAPTHQYWHTQRRRIRQPIIYW